MTLESTAEESARTQSGSVSNPETPGSLTVLLIATLVVLSVGLFTNRMLPAWDMVCYVDMASHGVVGNTHLVAPFAYRPGAPLIIGGIARLLHGNVETTFRVCAQLMCVAFILCCFCFARAFGATRKSAITVGIVLALYFYIIKWNAFTGTMVDIYAYPLVLLAFWALLRKRPYVCLVVCAVGLFFKEFLLVPLLTQAVFVVITEWRKWRNVLFVVGLTIVVLVCCFGLPRLLIHVVASAQDIDPLNNPASLSRLYSYPLSWRRDVNIVFSYGACWLPICMLVNRERWRVMRERLRPYWVSVLVYMAFQFVLVMYGGTNVAIFVTYSLPIQMLALIIFLDHGDVQPWELMFILLGVIVFNRLWMRIPLPSTNIQQYLEFYGGYHMLISGRSVARIGELGGWMLLAWLMRAKIGAKKTRNEHEEVSAAR